MAGPIDPNISKISPSQPPGGPQGPSIGGQDDASRADSFSMPKEPLEKGLEAQEGGQVKPFDLANQGQSAQPMPLEELQGKLGQINEHLEKVKSDIQDPAKASGISKDHLEAMNRVMDKMNPDMKKIAESTGSEYKPPEKGEGKGPLGAVMEWINGSQNALSGALNHLSSMDKPDMASMMKMQYSVQRATQRAELFSSIVGSTVSGIKTLMSTQLG